MNGIPTLLYSNSIYDSEKEIGIEMPIDKIINISYKTIVLIGVSGCGKTRTCFDMGRRYFVLFFDCVNDYDFHAMISKLEIHRVQTKTEENQLFYEALSERLVKCLISARLIVLSTIYQNNSELLFFEWFCIQRSRRSQLFFTDIFEKLSNLSPIDLSKLFGKLKNWFFTKGRIIFDESQYMLELLKSDYSATDPIQKHIINGSFAHPRSFFSFISRFIIKTGFYSIWCGTHMSIRNMDLLHSAAGTKPSEIYIFTDFNFLKASEIFKLLSKWLDVDLQSNLSLFEEISYCLQGRPRFITTFLEKLIYSSDINDCFRSYIRDMTTKYDSALYNSSLYYFWEQRIGWIIEPFNETDKQFFNTRLVSNMLIKLCISYLFGDGSSMSFSPDVDLVSTSLVMVKKDPNCWNASMGEPLVLIAGLNY